MHIKTFPVLFRAPDATQLPFASLPALMPYLQGFFLLENSSGQRAQL